MLCLFCNNYNKYRHICMTCRTGFVNWMVAHIVNHPDSICSIKLAAHKLLSEISINKRSYIQVSTRLQYLTSFVSLPPLKQSALTTTWPGFYMGNDTWIIPDATFTIKQPISWENAIDVIKSALIELDLYRYLLSV